MVTIGTGRDDPRRWVEAAYVILDAVASGEIAPAILSLRRRNWPPGWESPRTR
jgi:hypothetical protein